LNLNERNQIKEERARAMRETRDPWLYYYFLII
jgi:hypothetical protein